MNDIPAVYSLAEVAGRFNWTPQHFSASRASLENKHGFPTRLPGTDRWSRHAIEAWFNSDFGRNPQLLAQPASAEATTQSSETRRLETTYAA